MADNALSTIDIQWSLTELKKGRWRRFLPALLIFSLALWFEEGGRFWLAGLWGAVVLLFITDWIRSRNGGDRRMRVIADAEGIRLLENDQVKRNLAWNTVRSARLYDTGASQAIRVAGPSGVIQIESDVDDKFDQLWSFVFAHAPEGADKHGRLPVWISAVTISVVILLIGAGAYLWIRHTLP